MASVIVQAFEDSSTILGKFKLLDSFEGLLERDILHSELEKKHEDLLQEYLADLSKVQEIFLMGKSDPTVRDNAPPHAGAVAWVRGLLQVWVPLFARACVHVVLVHVSVPVRVPPRIDLSTTSCQSFHAPPG